MRVLGLDTATLTDGIALVDGDRVVAEARHDSSGRRADLLVAIDEVCRRAAIAPTALDAIAIGSGPGSFTGLRIGMATAKGIAFAARRPLWAVSSLAALAHDAARYLAGGVGAAALPLPPDGGAASGRVIVSVLDARRGEVYAGCFRDGRPLAAERVMAPDELAGWVDELAGSAPAHYAGDALAAHAALAALAQRWLPIATPSGQAVAWLGLAGARDDVLLHGAPTYIRPSEAEVKYPDGVPGALRRR